MDPVQIQCASCGGQWLAAVNFSVYEQQAVESCPCPFCSAYTLCCREPVEHPLVKIRRNRRRAIAPAC